MTPIKDNLPINQETAPNGGTITYAPEVIAIIAGVAANEIEGLAGMCTSGGLGDIINRNRNITRGVKVEVGSEEVSVDLFVVIEYGQPIQKVAQEVQENVRKNIEMMTALHVVRVDVHVQGVSFEKERREVQQSLKAAHVVNLEPVKDEVAVQDKKADADAEISTQTEEVHEEAQETQEAENDENSKKLKRSKKSK